MSDDKGIQVPGNNNGSIMIYESEGGNVRLDVRLENGTVWLTQQQMSLLYGKAASTINEHIGDIFADEELSPDACRKKFGISEFQQKAPFYYNLDMIIAVGFRVRSRNGVIFRKWAGERLNEYIVKGFTMDDERLKEMGGGGYWKELLNRIRDIRARPSSQRLDVAQYRLLVVPSPRVITIPRSMAPSGIVTTSSSFPPFSFSPSFSFTLAPPGLFSGSHANSTASAARTDIYFLILFSKLGCKDSK